MEPTHRYGDGQSGTSPVVGRRVQPGECYLFWDRYAYGFSEPCRDLVRTDVTTRVKRQVRAAMGMMLTPKRNRLLLKITGWPRLGFLNAIFQDASSSTWFAMDGRWPVRCCTSTSGAAVTGPRAGGRACSLPRIKPPGGLRSFIRRIAGLEWRIQLRAMEAARRALPDPTTSEIKYETFCDQPLETCRQVLGFSESPISQAFERHVAATPIKNASNRWRYGLTVAQHISSTTSCTKISFATATTCLSGARDLRDRGPLSRVTDPTSSLMYRTIGGMAWVAWWSGAIAG